MILFNQQYYLIINYYKPINSYKPKRRKNQLTINSSLKKTEEEEKENFKEAKEKKGAYILSASQLL